MPNLTTEAPRYLTIKEFQAAIETSTGRRLSKSSIYRAIRSCRVASIRIGGHTFIDRLSAERQMEVKLRIPDHIRPAKPPVN